MLPIKILAGMELIPQPSPNGGTILTNQVSEYDGQQRYRPDYRPKPNGCWNKVKGLGALDNGDGHGSWPINGELNCGDKCIMYTLEECVKDGKTVFPRAFIGKYYRSGVLAVNISDSLRAQTLSFVPWPQSVQHFLGIGICCTDTWCPIECSKLKNHLVLIKYKPSSQQFTFLADIGDKYDQDTVALGVEFSALFSQGPKTVYVYYQGSVLIFSAQITQGEIVSVSKTLQSPKIGVSLRQWGAGRPW